MPNVPPVVADVLRAAGTLAGIALIVAGTYDSRWIPLLGCLAVVGFAVTEYALARTRRWIREAETRTTRQLALAAARPALPDDGLLRLLEAVHRELRDAQETSAHAQAEFGELAREWNTLVQESMRQRAEQARRPVRSD